MLENGALKVDFLLQGFTMRDERTSSIGIRRLLDKKVGHVKCLAITLTM